MQLWLDAPVEKPVINNNRTLICKLFNAVLISFLDFHVALGTNDLAGYQVGFEKNVFNLAIFFATPKSMPSVQWISFFLPNTHFAVWPFD